MRLRSGVVDDVDAVMALWGSESSREDDPEEAVRAALELQEAVAELAAAGAAPLVMRVGISTGTASPSSARWTVSSVRLSR